MGCGDKSNTIQKTFIIEPIDIGGPTASACTALYTNLVQSCSGDTSIELSNGNIFFNGNGQFEGISASTIESTTFTSGGTNILDIIYANDTYVTGGTYVTLDNAILLQRNDGANVLVSGVTDFFTTGATLIGDIAYFHRNDQLSAYTLDLSSLDGGGGSANTFTTGFTYDGSNNLTLTRNDSNSFIATIDTMSGLTINGNLSVTGITNVGVISATTFYGDGSGLSGVSSEDNYVSGGTYNVSTKNIEFVGTNTATTFNVDVSSISGGDTGDTYVSGFTYDNQNNLTISLNNGLFYSVNISTLSGLTINGDITITGNSNFQGSVSAATFYGDGSGLTGVSGEDNYVSGATYNSGTTALDFIGTNSATTFSVDVSELKFLPIVAIDKLTGKVSLIGYGDTNACKIQRVETIGFTSVSTWSGGDDVTLDKIWANRYTYSYF